MKHTGAVRILGGFSQVLRALPGEEWRPRIGNIHCLGRCGRVSGLLAAAALGLPLNAQTPITDTCERGAIVRCLPEGSALADDIPIDQFAWPPQDRNRPCCYRADVDGDGQPEIVAAYYDKSWEKNAAASPGQPSAESEKRWNQAAVAVIEETGPTCHCAWKSDGWGYRFVAGMPQNMADTEYARYSESYFAVRDVTGDGIPEIIFTRSGYNAMGTLFEIWRHDHTGYTRVLCIDHVGLITTSGERTEITQALDHKGIALNPAPVWVWNGATQEFIRKTQNNTPAARQQ